MSKVCVIGLGKIGLPLALLLAKANNRVMGVDSNTVMLANISNSNLGWLTSGNEKELLTQLLGKSFFVTSNLSAALSDSETIFIAIGTGVGPDGVPELSNLEKLFAKISVDSHNVRGRLFVLKSTLPIGTTRRIAHALEESTGLKCGEDFFMAFCPERVLGDRAIEEMASLPKIIGGLDKESSIRAASIYSTIGGKIIVLSSPERAEMVKLLDNSYRQTLFAFANDFALLAELYGINAYEVIKAANDSYPRNNIPFPSGGVSGYCLTKDPLYLEASFKKISLHRGFPSVWFFARKSNDYMTIHMIDLLKKKLDLVGKKLTDSKILVCGITYKENTDDIRNSHGLDIAKKLRDEGATVLLWDPNVHIEIDGFQMVTNLGDALECLDALIFTVRHREFVQLDAVSFSSLVKKMCTPIIIDGWGMFQRFIGDKVVHYAGVGLPENEEDA
ncbi:MAG: nucleotide sugar dehydrogenase [Candidatus Bathyarchaeota archaeon]|nr:nucleotide sugar dehydrogenase [Candidatus Bathyarchaeota archaeon]